MKLHLVIVFTLFFLLFSLKLFFLYKLGLKYKPRKIPIENNENPISNLKSPKETESGSKVLGMGRGARDDEVELRTGETKEERVFSPRHPCLYLQ